MQFEFFRLEKIVLSIFTLILIFNPTVSAQQLMGKSKAGASRRISFSEAKRLLSGEIEGNLSMQSNTFSRTKLSTGKVLEVYYPISAPARSGRSKNVTVPGYGLLYESEAAFKEANRTRHLLEDLIPDGQNLISEVPQLVARLEKRLRIGAGKLDYSRASLKRLDAYIAGFHRSHTTAQADPRLFQELTAYYGETLRRALNGEWHANEERIDETHVQVVPNIRLSSSGKKVEIKPWDSVNSVLYEEVKRGIGLTKTFDADMAVVK